MATTKILMVEDDEDDYILALDYLEELTFLDLNVMRAVNAEQALTLLREQAFDLCLLDYQLGAVNGLEVLKQAQALQISAPIIMLTGQSDDALDREALNAGAADYLIKSELNAGRFARAIRYALARRDVERERVERLKAEAENRSKNRFLAHLSHELRTPLTAILGYTELMLNSESGAKLRAELEVILRNGKHLLDLLNDVLDLSKIAADKLELNISEVGLNSLFADIYALMSFPAIDKGLKLTLHCAEPVPLSVFTDPTRVRQILINLINNAIKFTDEGRVDIYLKVATTGDGEQLVVEVVDTGLGIPADQLESIFKPFSQVADVISKNVGGSGLGLAISSELASRLGGSLTVASEYGKGSCFTLLIGVGDITGVARERLSFEASQSQQQSEHIPLSGRVLVVDDLQDIRRLIGHFVALTGAEVFYACNGREAVNAVTAAEAKASPFDLILMDIHMPEMSGIDAVQQLRAQQLTGPIVALTAASMRGSRTKLIKAGFDDLLSKPIDNHKLFSLLKVYLQEGEDVSRSASEPAEALQVLLVEDDEDAASALSMLLESLGAQVQTHHSVAEAKQAFAKQAWDLVLLDVNLPDDNGLRLAEYIRQFDRDCFVASISGESIESSLAEASRIDRCLLKPIQLEDLRRVLEAARSRKIELSP